MLKLILLSLLISLSSSTNEDCTVGGKIGTCISTSTCSSYGGTYYSGYCPGSNDIRCCIEPKCSYGLCKSTSQCTTTTYSGLCPGGNNFMCCKTSSGGDGGSGGQSTGNGAAVLAAARKQKGQLYAWGGGTTTGPSKGSKQTEDPYCYDGNHSGFDCSGLTLYSVYQGCKFTLERTASAQYNQAKRIGKLYDYSQAQPGDIIFFNYGSGVSHVAIYAGNGNKVHAPGHYSDCTPKPVTEDSVYTPNVVGVGRFC